MKLYSKIIHSFSQLAVGSMLMLGVSTCYDEKMEWGTDYNHPNFADLPVELREQIDRYNVLKAYTQFVVGAGIDFDLYTNNEAYRNIVNENFKQATAGNAMKQEKLMKTNGELDFSKADPVIMNLKSAGLDIYGHVLVWHRQQRAGYFNSMIKPTFVPCESGGYNYVGNGDLETGEINPMAALNPGDGITVSSEAAYKGSYGIKAIASASSVNEWDLQFSVPDVMLDPNKEYTMSFMIKSDGTGLGRISFSGFDNEWPYQDWDGTGAKALFDTDQNWKLISFDFAPVYKEGVDKVNFNFDIGKTAGVTYFIDDIKIEEKGGGGCEPTYIEKTPEEKFAILEPVFINYIKNVVEHFTDKNGIGVTAWEVVNEPMNENGTKREGEENMDATDIFYWQYYFNLVGKDYAFAAFKAARESADPNTKLFINEFNLESANGAKLDGLLKYVEDIDNAGRADGIGTLVDGIGTQMHLNINWSGTEEGKEGIKKMFEKLAATGKLIKITELDIAIDPASGTDAPPASQISPTLEQYAQQAELYRYVAEMYTQIIPVDKQAGITLWGITNSEEEQKYWRPNDDPCLWDAKFLRKHAYKGFADGLAGYDVGATFKQDTTKWSGR